MTLEDQDRTRWDRAEIEEGLGVLDLAQRSGARGRTSCRPRSLRAM